MKDGGSSHLGQFISSYRKNTDKFAAPGLANPVIVLFDNDSGRKSICNTAKEARLSGKAVDVNAPFSHIVKNLYLVPTPLLAGKEESKIEDFSMLRGHNGHLLQSRADALAYTAERSLESTQHLAA